MSETLRWMPANDLAPWDKNPRDNDDAVPAVARSIQQFGFLAPIVAWGSERRIIAGHTRLKAVDFLRMNRWDDDAGDWTERDIGDEWQDAEAPGPYMVPVRITEFASEADAAAYAMADNRLGELADWDNDAVSELLKQLDQDDDFGDLTVIGWDNDELLAFGLGEPEPGEGGEGSGNADGPEPTEIRNYHPTVKPVALMKWLVRLVTPPDGIVLDPFMGSGTTGVAAVGQGFGFIGCELDPGHLRICRARIEHAAMNELDTERPHIDDLDEVMLFVGDCLESLRGVPDNSVDAVVTDPPYGLSAPPDIAKVLTAWMAGETYEHTGAGFMGADWDSFVPGPRVWKEVLRVLKPGGHAVVFAGTRTVDLMGIAVRLGGFEVRDCGQWCYWSGFPKSHDVSKGMDQMRDERDQILQLTKWIASARDLAGITNKIIDAHFGKAGMAGHWTSSKSQPSVPTLEQWGRIVELFGVEVPPEIHHLAHELNGNKGEWGSERSDRETSFTKRNVFSSSFDVVDPGTPVTDDAKKWDGWGTAIKPAVEPWLLLRKPLEESTIARQVLATGTGALNIDACRFEPGDPMWPGPDGENLNGGAYSPQGNRAPTGYLLGSTGREYVQPSGRFPANLLYCPKASRAERELGCEHLPVMGLYDDEPDDG